MEASIWPCQSSDKSSEVWDMVSTWRGYERKTVEYLTKERRTSVDMFCDRHEVKPNRKFDSVRGLVNRNFRTVRPHFSIQFSISSPVIVRNRRIEPKFGLLNLSFNHQKQGKASLCPHIYSQNSHHSASLQENYRMRPLLAPDWRELSLRRSNACVPQRSQLFNRASRRLAVSGKPCLRDHLSTTTIYPCTVGWWLKTGFTVSNFLKHLFKKKKKRQTDSAKFFSSHKIQQTFF